MAPISRWRTTESPCQRGKVGKQRTCKLSTCRCSDQHQGQELKSALQAVISKHVERVLHISPFECGQQVPLSYQKVWEALEDIDGGQVVVEGVSS